MLKNKQLKACSVEDSSSIYVLLHIYFIVCFDFHQIVEDSINFINEQTEVDKLLVKCQTISKRIGIAIRDQSKRSEVRKLCI